MPPAALLEFDDAHLQPWDEPSLSLELQEAVRAFDGRQWREAFTGFSQLADLGHPQAAQLALLMRNCGPTLYGGHFPVSPERAARWYSVIEPVRHAA